jgi:hypothetical protein
MQNGAGFKDQTAAGLILGATVFHGLKCHAHQADGF